MLSRWVQMATWGALVIVGLSLSGPASATESGEVCEPEVIALEELSPSHGAVVRDLNADGWVAGQIPGGGPPMMWNPHGDAFYLDLLPIDGDFSVYAINAIGDIIGTGHVDNGSLQVGWMYTRAGEAKVLRPASAGKTATPYDINRDRVVVGQQEGKPIIWQGPNKRATWLPFPHWATGGAARGIGPRGAAQGYVVNADSEYFHARWSPTGHLQSVKPAPEGFGLTSWINDYSGRYVSGSIDDGTTRMPAVWGPDGLLKLDLPDDVIWGEAMSVTRSGYAAGGVQFADRHQAAFISTPTGKVVVIEDSLAASAIVDGHGLSGLFAGPGPDTLDQRRTCLSTLLP